MLNNKNLDTMKYFAIRILYLKISSNQKRCGNLYFVRVKDIIHYSFFSRYCDQLKEIDHLNTVWKHFLFKANCDYELCSSLLSLSLPISLSTV